MAEAPSILHPQPSAVIVGLARQTARNAVKAELRAKGLRVTNFSARDLSVMADDYLARHRAELIGATWERVRNAPALWELYEKEQRDRQRQIERQQRKQLGQSTTNNPTVTPDQVSKGQ